MKGSLLKRAKFRAYLCDVKGMTSEIPFSHWVWNIIYLFIQSISFNRSSSVAFSEITFMLASVRGLG